MLEVAPPLNAPTSTLVSTNGPAASVTVTTGPATSGGFSASSAGRLNKKSTLPTWLAALVDEMLLLKVVRSDDPGASTVSVVLVRPEPSAPNWMPSVPLAKVGSTAPPALLPMPCVSVADVRPASNTLPDAAPEMSGTSSVSVIVKVPDAVLPSKSCAV